jgi:hypothetical protein
VRRIYERSGWIDLGMVARYVVTIPGEAATDAAASWKKQGIANALRVALSPFRVARASHSRNHELVAIDEFDERSDEIWARAASEYRVLGRRDAGSLRWRFDTSPYADRYRRYLLLNRGFPTGYVVMRPTTIRGAATLRIVDYLAPLGELAALFSLCVETAERDGSIGFVDVLTRNRQATATLWTTGFVPANRLKALERFASYVRLMVTVAETDPLRATLADPHAWFLTGGDADIDLVELQAELAPDTEV